VKSFLRDKSAGKEDDRDIFWRPRNGIGVKDTVICSVIKNLRPFEIEAVDQRFVLQEPADKDIAVRSEGAGHAL
jgi:hypothetical protein